MNISTFAGDVFSIHTELKRLKKNCRHQCPKLYLQNNAIITQVLFKWAQSKTPERKTSQCIFTFWLFNDVLKKIILANSPSYMFWSAHRYSSVVLMLTKCFFGLGLNKSRAGSEISHSLTILLWLYREQVGALPGWRPAFLFKPSHWALQEGYGDPHVLTPLQTSVCPSWCTIKGIGGYFMRRFFEKKNWWLCWFVDLTPSYVICSSWKSCSFDWKS